jgi:2-dehydro-3-deoxyphosphogluconate aldolase/(4S)-4-hydroxy-2-oxoglutarate aldolase
MTEDDKSMNIEQLLTETRVVPLVQSDDPSVAIEISRALASGGLKVVEIVLRTDRALDCLREVTHQVSGVIAGAGTVLTAAQAEAALDNGAQFLVSPGLDDDIVKFFPASIGGGVTALKAFAGVFRSMRFIPTGGVSAQNLGEFLGVPTVLACGGSWLTPASAVEAGDFDAIKTLAEQAVMIVHSVRGQKNE